MPVCSADPTPVDAPVSTSKKSKVNTAQVAESRALAIDRCDTPKEFVRRIVYEGLPEKTLQYVTLGGQGNTSGMMAFSLFQGAAGRVHQGATAARGSFNRVLAKHVSGVAADCGVEGGRQAHVARRRQLWCKFRRQSQFLVHVLCPRGSAHRRDGADVSSQFRARRVEKEEDFFDNYGDSFRFPHGCQFHLCAAQVS